jgi:hypothetical protein
MRRLAFFAALTQVKPNADFGGMDTILNLFAAPPDPAVTAPGLSNWDIAYIEALKNAPRNMPANFQPTNMARKMRTLIQAEEAEALAAP